MQKFETFTRAELVSAPLAAEAGCITCRLKEYRIGAYLVISAMKIHNAARGWTCYLFAFTIHPRQQSRPQWQRYTRYFMWVRQK